MSLQLLASLLRRVYLQYTAIDGCDSCKKLREPPVNIDGIDVQQPPGTKRMEISLLGSIHSNQAVGNLSISTDSLYSGMVLFLSS